MLGNRTNLAEAQRKGHAAVVAAAARLCGERAADCASVAGKRPERPSQPCQGAAPTSAVPRRLVVGNGIARRCATCWHGQTKCQIGGRGFAVAGFLRTQGRPDIIGRRVATARGGAWTAAAAGWPSGLRQRS